MTCQFHPTLYLFLLTTLLIGCTAVTEQFKRNYQESTESYYAPDNLGTDIQSTGILLIDAVKKVTFNTMPISGASIVNIDNPEKKIIFGSFKTGGFLSQGSGVVVIPNLKPGAYKIVKIKTQNVNMWETLFMPKTKEYEIVIFAGKPSYFGRIEVKHPMGTTNRIIKLNHEPSREVESWKLVVEKYKESPWVNIINSHIRELK